MSVIFTINIAALLFSCFVAGVLIGIALSPRLREKIHELVGTRARQDLKLARTICNPLISSGTYPWDAEAVCNPAAVSLRGRIHLIYRAIGMDGVSRLGHASSANGINFDVRTAHPVFTSQNPRAGFVGPKRYSPVIYPSGGSWGGCEDPRMVRLDGKVYVTFNMFDGWDFIRVAAISISEQDFDAGHWHWSLPTLISSPGQVHKNWVLFPERIGGKIAILHSITPKVEITYRDSLEAIGTKETFIESWAGARSDVRASRNTWDSFVRSPGPPPLKTPYGWLVFYHAHEEHERHRYKLGAMLLDLKDPTIIRHRSIAPVLAPDESYENNGKPGIIYACGAVIRGEMVYVYYGGADKVVCVAFAPLAAFLKALVDGGRPALKT